MRHQIAAALLVLALAGCTAAPPATPAATATPAPAATSTPAPSAIPLVTTSPSNQPTATVPATPVGTRFSWVLSLLNGAPVTETELADAFAPEFLAQVPVAQLAPVFTQIAAAGPFTVTQFAAKGDTSADALVHGTTDLVVSIVVDGVPPNRITGLLFKPAGAAPSATPVASWEEVDAALSKLAPKASLIAAEVSGGSCRTVHGLAAETPLAIGSAFKLYVLGALAQAVANGTAAWDASLAIRDDWKALPTGTMQDDPAGTTHTLREFATKMISISDNTAAQHVQSHLGRAAVEAMLAPMGMTDPTLDTPFIGARDMFVLKATKHASLTARYLAADAAGRRVILDGEVAAAPVALTDFADWTAPRTIDTVEWFASTADLCRAMAWLSSAAASASGAPVLEVLSVNPGVQFDAAAWPYVGFKGGSEPGVLNLTWLLRRADGRQFVLALTLNDPSSAADRVSEAIGVALGAAGLLAKEK